MYTLGTYCLFIAHVSALCGLSILSCEADKPLSCCLKDKDFHMAKVLTWLLLLSSATRLVVCWMLFESVFKHDNRRMDKLLFVVVMLFVLHLILNLFLTKEHPARKEWYEVGFGVLVTGAFIWFVRKYSRHVENVRHKCPEALCKA